MLGVVQHVTIDLLDEALVDVGRIQVLDANHDLLNHVVTVEIERAIPDSVLFHQLLDHGLLAAEAEDVHRCLDDSTAVAMYG